LVEVVSLQFLRCSDPQYVVRNIIYLDHVSLLRRPAILQWNLIQK
jgi:hypothetical protein